MNKLRQINLNEYQPSAPEEESENCMSPASIAIRIADRGEYISGKDKQLRSYDENKNIWVVADDKNALENEIFNNLGSKFSRSKMADAKRALQIKTSLGDDEGLNMGAKSGRITVKNGILNMNDYELRPHDKSLYNCYSLDANFNPDAKCPKWLKFLDGIFKGDKDKADKIKCLQQFTGLSMTTNMRYESVLFLSGTGSNGKGVFINTIKSILEPTCVNLSLSDISDPNRAVSMIGKTLAFDPDMSKNKKFHDDIFKKAVSGEGIPMKVLYKDATIYEPTCKFMIAGNQLPRTADTSSGFFRRWLIIKFNQNFQGRQNFSLKDELLDEKDGILNWMIEGLKSLEKEGKITEPESSAHNKHEYKTIASPVQAFFQDEITVYDPSTFSYVPSIKAKDLFNAYLSYCEEANYKGKLGRNSFYKDFKENFDAEITKDRNKCDVFRGICFTNGEGGIKIKDPNDYPTLF